MPKFSPEKQAAIDDLREAFQSLAWEEGNRVTAANIETYVGWIVDLCQAAHDAGYRTGAGTEKMRSVWIAEGMAKQKELLTEQWRAHGGIAPPWLAISLGLGFKADGKSFEPKS